MPNKGKIGLCLLITTGACATDQGQIASSGVYKTPAIPTSTPVIEEIVALSTEMNISITLPSPVFPQFWERDLPPIEGIFTPTSPTPIPTPVPTPVVNRVHTENPYFYLIQEYFHPEDWEWANRVSWCESRWLPDAYNESSGASGLFQHLERYYQDRWDAVGFGDRSIFDAEANTAASAWLYYNYGPEHWECKWPPVQEE